MIDEDTSRNSREVTSDVTRYLTKTQQLREAAMELHALLADTIAGCDRVTSALAEGCTVLEVVHAIEAQDGPTHRRDVHGAMRRFDQALKGSRGEFYRTLINDGGTSVADVARTVQLSAQMIRRLVRASEEAD